MTGAREVVEALGMQPHPEGGWYAETWRASSPDGARPTGSAILYLLSAGERSHWHRVDADEVWQYSGGDSLELRVWAEGDPAVVTHRLGPGFAEAVTEGTKNAAVRAENAAVQVVVPAGAWQAARPLGAWTLVGCIVTPAFDFAGFELAPAGWEPPVGALPG